MYIYIYIYLFNFHHWDSAIYSVNVTLRCRSRRLPRTVRRMSSASPTAAVFVASDGSDVEVRFDKGCGVCQWFNSLGFIFELPRHSEGSEVAASLWTSRLFPQARPHISKKLFFLNVLEAKGQSSNGNDQGSKPQVTWEILWTSSHTTSRFQGLGALNTTEYCEGLSSWPNPGAALHPKPWLLPDVFPDGMLWPKFRNVQSRARSGDMQPFQHDQQTKASKQNRTIVVDEDVRSHTAASTAIM